MKNFGLYLVITDPATSYETCAEAAVRAGVRFVQLRMKHVPRERIVATAKNLRSITAGTRTLFIVNDDPAIADEVGADGVHLGQSDLPIPAARERFPSLKIFGLSTHSLAQVEAACKLAPDYIGVGPVYATPTKEIPDATLGLETMQKMLAAAPCPAVAIGGIDASRLPDVLCAGARNFAVVRAVCGSADPYSAICRLQEIFSKH
ncbi:MAG: thiamine phosphate synthase [Opitutales bacterium]|nr:thiamine phosphate synthase [Opitutales bacterium]